MNILIIEDDPMTLKLVQYTCAKEGHNVTTATSGIEGLESLKKNSFDLVIADEVLPGLNGHEIAEWIRQDARYHQTPMILMSAESNSKFFGELAANGLINMFIPKPFSVMQLLSAVNMSRLLRIPAKTSFGVV